MKRIIISRTDSIGDVILTLPMAGVLKNHFPGCKIYFLGKNYTRAIIEACEHVDEFVEWEDSPLASRHSHLASRFSLLAADIIIHAFPVKEICRAAKEAGIPVRIATSHRWYSWLYCNKLLHFSRKNSDLHEAQLNLKMLEALGIKQNFSLIDIPNFYGLTRIHNYKIPESPASSQQPVARSEKRVARSEKREARSEKREARSEKRNIILHPKSKGSAREWGLDNFSALISLLPEDQFNIYITGTKDEGLLMQDFLKNHENRVVDLTGKLTLPELISFIGSCDGLVAASTGPLHIAAALGINAIGLYAPMKPIYPKRWAPLGLKADFLVLDKKCNKCRNSSDCFCIRQISPNEVAVKLGTLRIQL